MLFGLPDNEKSVKVDYGDKKVTPVGGGKKEEILEGKKLAWTQLHDRVN